MGLILAVSVLALAYATLQLYYLIQWNRIPEVNLPPDFVPVEKFSIILVAHNAEDEIESALNSLLAQDYPHHLFEVIVVDDRSTDRTVEIVSLIQHPSLRLIHLKDYPEFIHTPAYKKSGIEAAIHLSISPWIVITDADCTHVMTWLKAVSLMQQHARPEFLTGPVLIAHPVNLIEKMQQIENLTFMVITAAGIQSGLHDIANGANMAFQKVAFKSVNGYSGNYHYASGDDMFLIEKMRRQFPGGIRFIKSRDAIVWTKAKSEWNALIKQRLRWAGKNKGLKNPVISYIWLFVGFYHLLMLITLLGGFFYPVLFSLTVLMFIVKVTSDFMIVQASAGFFKVEIRFLDFFQCQFLYMHYMIRLGWNLLLRRKGDW